LTNRQIQRQEHEKNYLIYNCEKGDLGIDVDKLCSNLKRSIENRQNNHAFFDIEAMDHLKDKILQALLKTLQGKNISLSLAFCFLLILNWWILKDLLNISLPFSRKID